MLKCFVTSGCVPWQMNYYKDLMIGGRNYHKQTFYINSGISAIRSSFPICTCEIKFAFHGSSAYDLEILLKKCS